jgi:ASC-1-like (ASCH) protein
MNHVRSSHKIDWKRALLRTLAKSCTEGGFTQAFEDRESSVGIHLAIFVEPYLTYVLQGKKTIESRFSITRQPPFEQVQSGDVLVLKKTGGPVCGLCRVANVWSYRLDAKTWPEIERFSEALCMDGSDFWKKKKAASFATLMQVEGVRSLEEFKISKEDPRSWVVVRRTALSNQRPLRWQPSS